MNTTTLRQIIKEAITDRLKMIDEAGDKAAINAKIAKIEEDIQEAQQIMSAIPENISHYAAPEIVSDLKEDLQNSIDELEAKKQELQDSLTSMDKPVKAEKPAKAKKADKKEEPKKKAKKLDEELDTKKVYGGIAQNQGSTGSSLQFTVTENTPEYFEIDYTLTPNSKNRPMGAGSRSSREKEYGYAKISKKDFNGQITVKGENFNIGKDFITNNL
jgi:DNA repair exonuclease SbcCD ATPase subunit